VTAFLVNHMGPGNIITGRNADNAEVFRVTQSGDVEVRGVMLTSDRNAKTNFSHVSGVDVLEHLLRIPIQT